MVDHHAAAAGSAVADVTAAIAEHLAVAAVGIADHVELAAGHRRLLRQRNRHGVRRQTFELHQRQIGERIAAQDLGGDGVLLQVAAVVAEGGDGFAVHDFGKRDFILPP